MRSSIFLVLLFSFQVSFSQPFIKNETAEPLSFREMQRQYNSWARSRDISKEKKWKYFKRWEMEVQLHTDATGEPADADIFVKAVMEASEEKEKSFTAKNSVSAWYPMGPNVVPVNYTGYMENGIGRINCIAFHPFDPATYFAGVAQGGVWKTTNNGQTWIPLTDNLPITRVSDIAIDPINPDVMYISLCDFAYIGIGLHLNGRKRNTHYGLGVYKTTDGGVTWQPTGLSFQLTDGDGSLIKKIIINPNNTNNIIAAGVSGIYSSVNAGQSWTQTHDSLFWDMVRHPVNPNIIYAASGWVQNAAAGFSAIYKSNDFGLTWNLLNTGIPGTGSVQRIKLAIAPSDPDYVYALAVNTQSGLYGIYKTTDAGLSWQFIDPGVNILDSGEGLNSTGQGNYDLSLLVNNQNKNIVYTGGINIWGSTDGAQTFNPVSHWTTNFGPTVHADIHFIEQQPLTGNYFVCNDGGLYRTSNIVISTWTDANNGVPWPTQWTNISNGMTTTSFYRISSSRNSAGRIIGGSQDNATFYFDGSDWSTIFGGDGMDNYLDPVNDDNIIGSSQYGNFYFSDDDGLNGNWLFSNINSEAAEWTTPIVADYNQPGVFYIGYENVVKSTDYGTTWNAISNFPSGFNPNEISALAVANSNSNVLYTAKRVRYEYAIPGSVYKTINGGNTWSNITTGLPDSLYYTSIDIHNSNANTVFISMAGFTANNKVFMTTTGGTTWQNISYNLPNIPVNCVKHIPQTNYIIAATDIGIYTLDLSSNTWINQSAGLPNVIVTDIEFNVPLNKVYISTFGRGIWATDLYLFVSGPQQQAELLNFNLYPSPNNGSFTVECTIWEVNAELTIIDVNGRNVYSETLKGKKNNISVEALPSGLYFARIEGNNRIGVRKFIVE